MYVAYLDLGLSSASIFVTSIMATLHMSAADPGLVRVAVWCVEWLGGCWCYLARGSWQLVSQRVSSSESVLRWCGGTTCSSDTQSSRNLQVCVRTCTHSPELVSHHSACTLILCCWYTSELQETWLKEPIQNIALQMHMWTTTIYKLHIRRTDHC